MNNDDRTSSGNFDGFHHDEMDEFIDRLIDGSLPAGKEFSPLESALIEMSAFSAPEIEVGGSSVVERMSEEMEAEILSPAGHSKHAYVTRLLGVKVIIALTTAAAFTGASAAAASGSLPEPIQKAFSAAVSNLGVSLPSSPVTTTTTTSAAAPGQSQTVNSPNSQSSSTTTAVTNLAIGSGESVPPNSSSTVEPSSPNCLPLLAQSISSALSLTSSSSTTTTTVPPTTTT
ncbi:MAG: hypothetical protein HKL84_00975, partial [Acidimicrobiaceae bacterium]|nr:hypothetical protein [Acidimicrobiaceae bacterium]